MTKRSRNSASDKSLTSGWSKTGKNHPIRHTKHGKMELAMIESVKAGDVSKVFYWLKLPNINIGVRERGTSDTILHLAAHVGNTDLITMIVKARPELMKKRNKLKEIPAIVAAKRNNWDTVTKMRMLEGIYFPKIRFDKYCDINGRNIAYYSRLRKRHSGLA